MERRLEKLSEIKENPHNPRFIKDEEFNKLVQSIKDFPDMLELREIVVDETMMALGGNMRHKACIEAGVEETWIKIITQDDVRPTLERRGITFEELKKEFIIKDNVGFGQWDWEEIANNYDPVNLDEWGLDLPFDLSEENKAAEEDDFDIPDEIETNIKYGDVFEIGEHRLVCGDSTNQEDCSLLMGGEQADMVFTDPPYGVSYKGTNNPNGREWEVIKNDDLRGDKLYQFLFYTFENMAALGKDDIAYYVWFASSNHIEFETALLQAGLVVRQELIWNKGMILGHSDYHWSHEPMLYCKKKDQRTPWYGDRTGKTILGMRRTDLLEKKKEDLIQIIKNLLDTSTTWEIDRDSVRTYKHPTQKPVTLAGRALINSSKENDIIVDLFVGSGSTMVACDQLDRRCYGMELDPQYCQIIIDRMQAQDPEIKIKKNGKKYKK